MKRKLINNFLKLFFILIIVGTPITSLAKSLNAQLVDAQLLQEKFIEYLIKVSPWEKDEMEIIDLKVLPKNIWVPQGELSYKFSEPHTGTFLGRISSIVSIYVDGKPIRKARVCAYIECFKRVVCAKNGLIKGQIIKENDLKLIKLPISKLKGKFFESKEEIVGLSIKRTLRPGQVIYGRSLMKPIVVKRGSRVMIVAKSPFIEVTCPGIVVEKGGLGDFVRVKNLQSKKVIIAQVKDRNTVYVNF